MLCYPAVFLLHVVTFLSSMLVTTLLWMLVSLCWSVFGGTKRRVGSVKRWAEVCEPLVPEWQGAGGLTGRCKAVTGRWKGIMGADPGGYETVGGHFRGGHGGLGIPRKGEGVPPSLVGTVCYNRVSSAMSLSTSAVPQGHKGLSILNAHRGAQIIVDLADAYNEPLHPTRRSVVVGETIAAPHGRRLGVMHRITKCYAQYCAAFLFCTWRCKQSALPAAGGGHCTPPP